ncbi:DUF11 domain-containing protein [Agromyces sp. H66]|uniref:DUF11 domain-containing protein n=1 Tax=Agromyces sp. H66 TaxID=2529859 RepID=UPI0010AAC68F|nr:DUF11 domain-containing protein [Agromyces sp. H66]
MPEFADTPSKAGRRRTPSRRALVSVLAGGGLIIAGTLVGGPPAVAAPTTPLTVTIMSVDGVGDDLDGTGRSDADLYAGVEFGTGTVSAFRTATPSFETHVDDEPNITPFWPITGLVDVYTVNGVPTAKVTLSIWDHDDCDTAFCTDTGVFESDDDQLDVKPGAGETVELTIDMGNGRWSGDVAWPANCVTGDGGEAVKACFDVSVDSASGDADGDGLLDGWERNGFDADSDGAVDVDLPGFGATVGHRDLFLELDYSTGQAPRRDDIQAMRDAFADAPLGNPDGVTGVRLHVDTGPLVDTTVRKNQPLGTCSDGIDNGGDGRIDAADPDCDNVAAGTSGEYLETSTEDPGPANCTNADAGDPTCLVGDDLGGGNLLPQHLNNCGVDAVFYNAKNGGGAFPTANFDPDRRWIFRYAISTQSDQDTDGAGPDTGCGSGGQGEIGGNDFVDFNHDGGTVMHELGHTLGLRHGGNENGNCKPNYVSIMDYDEQFGIARAGGGAIIDYSPPRIDLDGDPHGAAPLSQLVENALDENVVLDSADNRNLIVFKDGTGARRSGPLTGGVDWSGNTAISAPGTIEAPTNINGSSPPGPTPAPPAPAPQQPAACASNTSTTDTLNGFHDWNAISIPFRQFGDSSDGALNPADEILPTIADRDVMIAQLNTADVSVSLADGPDPVGAGEQFTVTATATNTGPNPANSTEVTVTVPSGLDVVSTSVTCVTSASTVRCNLGSIAATASRSFQVVLGVPAGFLYPDATRAVTTTASVDNLAGPDPNAANDTASTTTKVITKADVSVTDVRAAAPLEILVGQTGQAAVAVDVANAGPTSPVDARVDVSVSGDGGLLISPTAASAGVTALAIGAGQTATPAAFDVTCTAPGYQSISVSATIVLTATDAVDPVPANNQDSVQLTVDCVVPIAINVRPGGWPNSINLNTDATLAALTTKSGEYGLPIAFDATTIDPSSARWGLRDAVFNTATVSGAPEIHSAVHRERSYEPDDRTRDRDLDGVMHFKPSDSGITSATTEACLKVSFRAAGGATYRGLGCDAVRVVS